MSMHKIQNFLIVCQYEILGSKFINLVLPFQMQFSNK